MKENYKFFYLVILLEIAMVILYGIFTEFPINYKTKTENLENITNFYPMYQDIHVMIFIGFGFLMVFLRQASWQAVTFNFFVAAFVIQWGILTVKFWQCVMHNKWEKILLDITWLIQGDFAAASVLISFGGVLGKVNAFQLLTMAFIEVIFYSLCLGIGIDKLLVVDIGGAIFIHSFGAYFGLACSYFLSPKASIGHKSYKSSYNSNLIAMVGTLFLWIYWPSFNAALAVLESGNEQIRSAVNTILSITCSCLAAFAWSSKLNKGKFEMEDILNATLAGGVIMGAACDIIIRPFGSMLCGLFAGTVSTFGFRRLSGYLAEKIGLHDTCGIHNLHGMPGILGGIVSAIASASVDESNYGGIQALRNTFKARDPAIVTDVRDGITQGSYQIAALVITLAIALFTGSLTGILLRQPFFEQFKDEYLFKDVESFELPHDEEHNQLMNENQDKNHHELHQNMELQQLNQQNKNQNEVIITESYDIKDMTQYNLQSRKSIVQQIDKV